MPGEATNPSDRSSALAAGSLLGPYCIIRRVGQGGMGLVFLARDQALARDVAVKVLRPDAASDTDSQCLRDRFLREAKAAARISHPNIAAVYQIGHDGDLAYLAMEWLPGGSMSDHLRHQVILDWRDAVAAARDAAHGLAAAHAAGVIHRDVKPSNLMRAGDGRVKLVDFGLARLSDASVELTASGAMVGTPAYLSPEQCRGEPATPLSDVYGLACTLFHLLTGRPPFTATGVAGLLYQHAHEPMPDVRRFADELPAALSAILAKAGAKSPADRYPSATALADDLTALLEGRSVTPAIAMSIAPARVLSVAPPPQAKCDVPNNLPREFDSFIGREAELAATAHAISQSRLITLTGPGGTGKTRLAAHAASLLLSSFPGGVWFVELASLPTGADVLPSVLAALNLRDQPGQSSVEAVAAFFSGLRALLLIDNCEHVIDGVRQLVQVLLEQCASLQVLATSRIPLQRPGERVLSIAPLAAPDPDLPEAELAQNDAVRLFVDRAIAVRPAFALSRDAYEVGRICRRVDGIPLAIELAAARLRLLTPAQIADRLDHAFRVLAGGTASASARQQTLRATIDWSFDLLPVPAKSAFVRCGVFAGGFAVEAAEAVLPDGVDLCEADVLDLLGTLCDHALVQVTERDGLLRYGMLETVRQYAVEKLEGSPVAAALKHRHAVFFADQLDSLLIDLVGKAQATAIGRFAADAENTNIALANVMRAGDEAVAVRLGIGIGRFAQVRGGVSAAIRQLESVLPIASSDSAELSMLLTSLATLVLHKGERDRAELFACRALSIAEQRQRPDAQGIALNALASIARERGDHRRAMELWEQSLATRRASGDAAGEAVTLNNLGVTAHVLGDAESALRYLRQAVDAHRRLGDTRRAVTAQMNVAEMELELGRADAAKPLFASAERTLLSLGDEWTAAYATEGLGRCALLIGDAASARAALERAIVVLRKSEDRPALADALGYLARAALLEARVTEAEQLSMECIDIRSVGGDEVGMLASLELRAAVLAQTDPDLAVQMLGCAELRRREKEIFATPTARAEADRLKQQLRTRLGEAVFLAAMAIGQSRSPADLLAPI